MRLLLGNIFKVIHEYFIMVVNKKYNQRLYHFQGFTKNDVNLVKLSNVFTLHSKSHCHNDGDFWNEKSKY